MHEIFSWHVERLKLQALPEGAFRYTELLFDRECFCSRNDALLFVDHVNEFDKISCRTLVAKG
ncbi:hypothetical protein WYI_21535 [Ochrobactrum sp. CDB2]|jgi:hypothetical protein|nr:hypothetical protein WYI_21535 [Ochrobactrum sp. CDB2]